MIALPEIGAIPPEPETERRQWLGRKLNGDGGRGRLLIIGCNPSTASAETNDPTISKEIKFATRWGFDYLDKCNIFDWRSTDPLALKKTAEPVSRINEAYILSAASRCSMVLCAWGKNGALQARGARTKRVLLGAGAALFYLRLNADGSPQHPLYLPDDTEPKEWLAQSARTGE